MTSSGSSQIYLALERGKAVFSTLGLGGGFSFPSPTRTSTPPQSLSGFKNSEEEPFLGRQDPKAEVLWDGEQDRRLANKV